MPTKSPEITPIRSPSTAPFAVTSMLSRRNDQKTCPCDVREKKNFMMVATLGMVTGSKSKPTRTPSHTSASRPRASVPRATANTGPRHFPGLRCSCGVVRS